MGLSMIDPNWLFAVAGSAAAFDAIVGAFYTSKILSIASEKRALTNRINSLETEISYIRNKIKKIDRKIDLILSNWIKEDAEKFLNDMDKILKESGRLPEIRETLKEFLEGEEKRIERRMEWAENYIKNILGDKYNSYLTKVKEKIKKEKNKEWFRTLDSQTLKAFNDALDWYPFALIRWKKIDSLEGSWWQKNKINESMKEKTKLLREIESKFFLKNELLIQKSMLTFPGAVWIGFASLVLFAILGVVWPLAFMPLRSHQLASILQFSILLIWILQLPPPISPLTFLEIFSLIPNLSLYMADWLWIFCPFLLGLFFIFSYLIYEIKGALQT